MENRERGGEERHDLGRVGFAQMRLLLEEYAPKVKREETRSGEGPVCANLLSLRRICAKTGDRERPRLIAAGLAQIRLYIEEYARKSETETLGGNIVTKGVCAEKIGGNRVTLGLWAKMRLMPRRLLTW